MMTREAEREWHPAGKLHQLFRGMEFWRRATGIYLSYKVTQAKASWLRAFGHEEESITEWIWKPHNEATGQRMYDLCVDLRGFYLKGGQFLGTRADFIPEEICTQLSKLHDQVPPMPRIEVERLLKRELGVDDLSDVFSELDLDAPLGSASIAQVHKGRLRTWPKPPLHRFYSLFDHRRHRPYFVQDGEQAWDICNRFGVSYPELRRANKGVDLMNLEADTILRVPVIELMRGGHSQENSYVGQRRIHAAKRAMSRKNRPADGRVAIKVQYPDALEVMKQDLGNIRTWATFLSKTEIQFDLVSAVSELRKQIELEFDFTREARVMDAISSALQPINKRVAVPQSIPGLVTKQMLIMSYMDGIPLRSLAEKTASLSPRKQRRAKERILRRLCEAYGKMIFGDGLFQADGHPGNILVQKRARIALLDYGQSKKLTSDEIQQLGQLIVAIAKFNALLILTSGDRECARDDYSAINDALDAMGIVMDSADLAMKRRMAIGMFDTSGRVDPFDKDSPLKQCPISNFPSDLFFVLRVVQLIRGMKQGMEVGYPSTLGTPLKDCFLGGFELQLCQTVERLCKTSTSYTCQTKLLRILDHVPDVNRSSFYSEQRIMSLELSLEQLSQYRGEDASDVYIAVKGVVYNVTPASDFYGPGGSYHVFAGRECARALALMKLEVEFCDDQLDGLEEKHLKVLDDWVKRFNDKYAVVGKVGFRIP